MQRADSLEKTLMLGKIEGRRRRGQQSMRRLDGITHSMDVSLSKLWEMVKGQGGLVCCSPWGRKESDMTEPLNNNNRNAEEQGGFPATADTSVHRESFSPCCSQHFMDLVARTSCELYQILCLVPSLIEF